MAYGCGILGCSAIIELCCWLGCWLGCDILCCWLGIDIVCRPKTQTPAAQTEDAAQCFEQGQAGRQASEPPLGSAAEAEAAAVSAATAACSASVRRLES